MTRTYTFSIDKRARIFWTLVGIGGMSLALYFYAVLATVEHTVARENLKRNYTELSANVSSMEFQAIGMKNTLNLDTALSLGFNEVKTPLYVSRETGSLTLNTVKR